jgi:hypothetical protein
MLIASDLPDPGKIRMQGMRVGGLKVVWRIRVFGASHVQNLSGVVDLVIGIHHPHVAFPVAALEPGDRALEEGAGGQGLGFAFVVECNGYKLRLLPLGDELGEDLPRAIGLPADDPLDGGLLLRACPVVDLGGDDPVARCHVLGRVVDDDRVQTGQGNAAEIALLKINSPIADAPLMGAQLGEVKVAGADDLTVAILKQKALRPPLDLGAGHRPLLCGLVLYDEVAAPARKRSVGRT